MPNYQTVTNKIAVSATVQTRSLLEQIAVPAKGGVGSDKLPAARGVDSSSTFVAAKVVPFATSDMKVVDQRASAVEVECDILRNSVSHALTLIAKDIAVAAHRARLSPEGGSE